MIRIDVRSDIDRVISKLENLRRDQLPFAIAKAVTATAQIAKQRLRDEMPKAFNRPTPYTLNSLFLSPATKRIPVAKVWLKDRGSAGKGNAAADYLLPQIAGGGRATKRWEKRFAGAGGILSGLQSSPGGGAKLDAYGNVAGSQLERILSALGAAEATAGYSANRTERSKRRKGRRMAEYFIARPDGGHLHPGIWQRYRFAFGGAVKPILMFSRPGRYQVRYRFQDIANQVVREHFEAQFEAAYRMAVATAR